MARVLRAIIMGPPGSGKGTISNRIVNDFKVKHLSSGDVLRSQITHGTAAGIAAKKLIEGGKLVPDDVMCDLILGELEKLKSESWLLDGFPRTKRQAEELLNNENLDTVVNLDVPFDEIISRLKLRWLHAPSGRIYNLDWNPPNSPGIDDVTGEPLVQRDDDKPETVQKRLEAYDAQTQPLLHFFGERNLVTSFQGRATNELWPHIFEHLSKLRVPAHYTKYS